MKKKQLSSLCTLNIIIIVFSILICIFYGIFYLNQRDYLMATSSIVVILLLFAIYPFEKIVKHSITNSTKLLYLSFVLLSAVLGAIANLYETVVFYDKVVHFLSGVLLAFIFLTILKHFKESIKYKRWIIILGTTIFNAAIAAFWEIGEFCFDLVFNKKVQRGLTDTMTDMISAIIGSIIISLILINKLKENRETFKMKTLTKE